MSNDGPRVRSPGGRGRCQLNYPRREKVVQVDVLDKVKQARQEVQQQYGADVMGVRGPQWTCSTALPDTKYSKSASDARLANQLLASAFCRADMRATRPPPRPQRYDTQHYSAFTRGEVTTGWNHSTEPPSAHQLAAQQRALDARAAAGTARARGSLARYKTPAQREEAFAGALRQQKQAAAARAASLVVQYGPEGAAAMQHILAMRRRQRPVVHIKASREDVARVRGLPGLGLAEDDAG